MKTMRIVLRASLVIAAIMAASKPRELSGQELPAAQISAGYSHLGSPSAILVYGTDESGDASHSGWFGEVVGNIAPHVGVVGHVSATYTTGTVSGKAERAAHRAYSFLGGWRATSRCCRRVAPFGQVLAGMVRVNAVVTRGGRTIFSEYPSDYFALLFGGGADIRFGAGPAGLHLAGDIVRIGNGNDGFDTSGHTWRLLAGITVPMR